jgi:hypothetical protein
MLDLFPVADKSVRRQFVNRKKRTVTKMAEQNGQTTEQPTAREVELEAAQKKAEEVNKTRTGKGTRVRVGQTRGKNPHVISWEAFDESLPDSLPGTLAEFMEITKTQDEKVIVGYLIDGYSAAQYTAASDPIAEFVNPAWSDDVQKQFRLVVRNYSNATGVSLEDAVALIKPGIEASQKKA